MSSKLNGNRGFVSAKKEIEKREREREQRSNILKWIKPKLVLDWKLFKLSRLWFIRVPSQCTFTWTKVEVVVVVVVEEEEEEE